MWHGLEPDKMPDNKYDNKLTVADEHADTDLSFVFETPGIYYIDNVRIEEDSLIKNGSFNAGFSGYEPYVDSSISSDVTYVVDSLSEDNAADFTINNTGDAAWKIQLKQNNVEIEKGQWYRLSLDAKASIPRELMFAQAFTDDSGNYVEEELLRYTADESGLDGVTINRELVVDSALQPIYDMQFAGYKSFKTRIKDTNHPGFTLDTKGAAGVTVD